MKKASVKRLILLGLVALVLAPGTWVRSPRPASVLDAGLVATAIPLAQPRIGALQVRGMWKLNSRHSLFGGYSGLAALANGQLLAGSDRGAELRITLQDGVPVSGNLAPFAGQNPDRDKIGMDLEALTIDPASGQVWAAFEYLNAVVRYAPDGRESSRAVPAKMAHWPANSGPEALVRLSDGRFIALAEGWASWAEENQNGVLFDGDPTEKARSMAFDFRGPEGYRPTDMAALPDGRVLILMRTFTLGLPLTFLARIVVADPADITEDGIWRGQEIARFQPPLPTDNFEGLAVVGDDYPVTLWMISDDNTAMFQNTLLMKMTWDGKLPEE